MKYVLVLLQLVASIVFAAEVSIKPLELTIDDDIKTKKQLFKSEIKPYVDVVNKSMVNNIAIAAFGGSKVTAFIELDLDGLIIIDYLKPGTKNEILDSYLNPIERDKLYKAVMEGINSGGMSTTTTNSTSLSAQIISRLKFELNATDIELQYLISKDDQKLLEQNNAKIDQKYWSKGIISENEPTLLTLFSFKVDNNEKSLILLSYLATSDNNKEREQLPFTILKDLASNNYNWLYHSADGLVFFSDKDDNNMQEASRSLLKLIRNGGGVILDYPTKSYYRTFCYVFNDITSMCARKDLEAYGVKLLSKTDLFSWGIFGYCGPSDTGIDSVKIYQVQNTNRSYLNINKQPFDFSRFVQIGEAYKIIFE